ncbi:MAG: hypothetical protein L0332_22985 [Chloroflexi bacterium]|nr:hypothetical protein [Chloroflexota bacterium]MCI0578218.1 hypothetical protein [Chloroflexota bacterium]MCI0645289.1 hypothetical protein [Chloroflexota bacterium]MCI0729557.1 hypothetical protein [Chloroflexota bacterium]
MDPATIATLIGVAASAATSSVEIALSTLTSNPRGKNPVAGVFINNTPVSANTVVGYGKPIHGEMLIVPAATVPSLLDVEQEEGGEYKESNNTTWGLKSVGKGSACVIVFQFSEFPGVHTAVYAALYTGKPTRGNPYGGVSLSQAGWFEANQSKYPDDDEGHWIADHIKSVHTDLCCYSNGETVSAQLGLLKVVFQPGIDEARFEMQFLGDWSPYSVAS